MSTGPNTTLEQERRRRSTPRFTLVRTTITVPATGELAGEVGYLDELSGELHPRAVARMCELGRVHADLCRSTPGERSHLLVMVA